MGPGWGARLAHAAHGLSLRFDYGDRDCSGQVRGVSGLPAYSRLGRTGNHGSREWRAGYGRSRPGKFARLNRTWKNGDRIEIEFDMPTALEAVDAEHPNMLATLHGPLALFGVGQFAPKVTKAELLAAEQISSGSTDWQVKTASGPRRCGPLRLSMTRFTTFI